MAEIELDKLITQFAHSNKAEGKSLKTISWYSEMLKGFNMFLESIGSMKILSNFDMQMAREFVVHEQERNLSPFTIQGKVRALKAFSSWLYREGYTGDNLLSRFKLPKVPQNLIDVGIFPRVKAVLTPYNIGSLEMLVEEMAPLGVNKIDFTIYEPSFYRDSDGLSLSDREKSLVAETLEPFPKKYPGIKFEGNAMPRPARGLHQEDRTARWKSRAACSGGRSDLGITADGKAVLCEQTPQETPFVFGNMRKSTILDVWQSKALRDFIFPAKEKFKKTVCYGCEEFVRCQYELGNCFREAYFATGNPFNAPPNCPHREPIPRIGDWRNRTVPTVGRQAKNRERA